MTTSNQLPNNNGQIFDLGERTLRFGKMIVRFCRGIGENATTRPIISQLVRSGTSIGANYCEANEANSKKDFRHKLGIAKKEAKETMYWLRVIIEADIRLKADAQNLWQEAHEFVLIFASSLKK